MGGKAQNLLTLLYKVVVIVVIFTTSAVARYVKNLVKFFMENFGNFDSLKVNLVQF